MRLRFGREAEAYELRRFAVRRLATRDFVRLVLRVAFSPPMARELSRRPRAPTRDLPSFSC